MILFIDTLKKTIRVEYEELHITSQDFSWIPSDVYQLRWYGTEGQIQYYNTSEKKYLIESIDDIGIYGQAVEMFNNEKKLQEELKEAARDYWQELRDNRNAKLADSDWTQILDSPLSEIQKISWRNYRQELRDLPKNTVDPKNPVWPLAPES